MEVKECLTLALEEEDRGLARALDSLTPVELSWRPAVEANSIGFTFWHHIRAEDAMVQAAAQGKPQLWISEKWHEKMNRPADPRDSGGGFTVEQVAAFSAPPLSALLDYRKAVRAATLEFVQSLDAAQLEKKVPFRRDREVTVGWLMIHVVVELNQHLGQIAYIRGMFRGLNK